MRRGVEVRGKKLALITAAEKEEAASMETTEEETSAETREGTSASVNEPTPSCPSAIET